MTAQARPELVGDDDWDGTRVQRDNPGSLSPPWMRFAVCQGFPELPWLDDQDAVSERDRLRMAGACRACGVVERCTTFVARENVTGGFWAGEFRDIPETSESVNSTRSGSR